MMTYKQQNLLIASLVLVVALVLLFNYEGEGGARVRAEESKRWSEVLVLLKEHKPIMIDDYLSRQITPPGGRYVSIPIFIDKLHDRTGISHEEAEALVQGYTQQNVLVPKPLPPSTAPSDR
jgi:hypothetical protein